MPELDLWAERHEELARLVARLTPAEALEVLRQLVAACPEGSTVAPALAGMIRGIVERRGAQTDDS